LRHDRTKPRSPTSLDRSSYNPWVRILKGGRNSARRTLVGRRREGQGGSAPRSRVRRLEKIGQHGFGAHAPSDKCRNGIHPLLGSLRRLHQQPPSAVARDAADRGNRRCGLGWGL
jgi:hypothetical protein